jgi:hypothetical protein
MFQSSLSLDAEPWRPMNGRGLPAAAAGSKSVSPSAVCGEQRALSVEEVGNMLRATGLEEKERRMSREASPTAEVAVDALAPPGLSLFPVAMKQTMEHATDGAATVMSDKGGLTKEAVSGHCDPAMAPTVQEE